MEYHFENDQDYLAFRDYFAEYLYRHFNPFFFLLENKLDWKTHGASHAIGEAHYGVFLSELSKHPFTPLAIEERTHCNDVAYEMNVAVIRHDLDTGRNSWSYDIAKEVRDHKCLFPCSFAYGNACSVSLPEEYEPLLDRILAFRDAAIRFDSKELAAFLASHYQGLDAAWAEERLSFLSNYYGVNERRIEVQSTIQRYRRKEQ